MFTPLPAVIYVLLLFQSYMPFRYEDTVSTESLASLIETIKSDILMVVSFLIVVFWVIVLSGYQHFGKICCRHMVAECFSRILISMYKIVLCHNSENNNLEDKINHC